MRGLVYNNGILAGYLEKDASGQYRFEYCLDSPFYSANGYYGRPDFLEFATRLGIIEKRASAILDIYIRAEEKVVGMIQASGLSQESRATYISTVEDRFFRISGITKRN